MHSNELDTLLMRLIDAQSRLRCVVFRATSPAYATPEHLVSGKGAQDAGGRWNPSGLASVYASLDESTALAEFGSRVSSLMLPVEPRVRHVVVTAITVSLERVAHLDTLLLETMSPKLRAALFVADYRSFEAAPPPSQSLGGRLAAGGIQALRVPSVARKGGECLVVFRPNISDATFTLPTASGG